MSASYNDVPAFFELYRTGGVWRWRLIGNNGSFAKSVKGYPTKRGAMKALQRFRSLPFTQLAVEEPLRTFTPVMNGSRRDPNCAGRLGDHSTARCPGFSLVVHDKVDK